ncbi:hypothetical protein BHU16_07190 [Tannerella sp. oral taxon 808]|nr:hypothetical protein BHU16_07190 [Tannerella sp. oral taxon 808]
MSRWKENKERKEREKKRREELGKFFLGLSKVSYTTLIVGAALQFVVNDIPMTKVFVVMVSGIASTFACGLIGNKFLK